MWGRLLGTSYCNVAASWLSLGTYSSKDRFLGKAVHSPSPIPALWGSVVSFLPFLTVNSKTRGQCHLFHVAPLRMKEPWATHSCQGVRSENHHELALNSQPYGLETSFMSSFPSGHELRDILNQQIKNAILKGAGKWILLSWALDQNSLFKKRPDEKAALHQNYTVNSKGIIIITNIIIAMANFREYLLWTRHYTQCFLYISSETCKAVLQNTYCYFPCFSNEGIKQRRR